MIKSNRKIHFGLVAVILMLLLSALACSLPMLQIQETGGDSVQSDQTSELETAVATVAVEEGTEPQFEVSGTSYLGYGDSLANLFDKSVKGVVGLRIISSEGGGQGSGFVIDADGHIVTNFHVVDGAEAIEVAFWNGYKTLGEVVGTDLDSDLAVVKVDVPAEQLFPLPFGDSEKIRVGEVVVAIGNPFDLGITMTAGIISAKGRVLSSLNFSDDGSVFSAGDIIQTDAAINPGNSGGPLLNINGEVVGINRAIQVNFDSGSPENSGIGFSISVNILKRVVQSLIETGSYSYPLLGIRSSNEITIFDQQQLGLPQTTGAYVGGLSENGPSREAGVEVGDLITHIDGREIIVFGDLLSYLLTQKAPGETVELTVIRSGESLVIPVVLGSR